MVARGQLAAGSRVRVFGRDPTRLGDLAGLGAEIFVGDLSDHDTLVAACKGADKVFTSAHGFMAGARRGSRAVDLAGNRNLVRAAADCDVAHLVFTSVYMNEAMTAIDFMAHKRATEAELRASGLAYTILRPTAFMDTWAWLVGSAMLGGRPVVVYGDGKNPVNFVAAADVANVACMALARTEAVHEEVGIGGPENLSQLQVIEIFERVLERAAEKKHVPTPILRAMSLIVKPFRPAVARQLLTGYFMAGSSQTFPACAAGQQYPLPMTRFEDWIRQQWLPCLNLPKSGLRQGGAVS